MNELALQPLGRFVRYRERRDGTHSVFFSVPSRLRPKDWPPTIRLPQTSRARGRLSDANFAARIAQEADRLNERLDELRDWEDHLERSNGRDIRTLAQIYYRTARFRVLTKGRQDRARWNVARIIEWSDSRHGVDFGTVRKDAIEDFLWLYEDRKFMQLDLRSLLNILFNEAVAVGWRSDNPIEKMGWTAPKPELVNIWERADVERYANAAVAAGLPALGAFMAVQFEAGQRSADLLSCRWDKNLDDGALHIIQSKTGNDVHILIRRSLVELLEGCRVEGSPYVFADPATGKPYSWAQLSYRFRGLRHSLSNDGDPLLELRALRHSAVCRMVRAGIHPLKIASTTGHQFSTVFGIIKHYAIDRDGFAQAAMMELNRAEGGTDDDFLKVNVLTGGRNLRRGRKLYKRDGYDQMCPHREGRRREGRRRLHGDGSAAVIRALAVA